MGEDVALSSALRRSAHAGPGEMQGVRRGAGTRGVVRRVLQQDPTSTIDAHVDFAACAAPNLWPRGHPEALRGWSSAQARLPSFQHAARPRGMALRRKRVCRGAEKLTCRDMRRR